MVRLAVLSDIHMRPDHAEAIEAALERVCDHLESTVHPDRVICLGDLIQHQDGDPATDERMLERVRETLAELSCPVTYLLGNHDVENLDRATIGTILGQRRFHGTATVDDVPLVFLDTSWASVAGARGILGGPQLEWLATELPAMDRTLVFAHHPIGFFDLAGNPWFESFPERAYFGDRREFLTLVRDHCDVRATLSGHIHATERVDFWDIPHCSIGAFSKSRPDVPLSGTYAVVSVEESISVAVRTVEEVLARFVC